jgi:tetratricopeptide (TPR) repeat protein
MIQSAGNDPAARPSVAEIGALVGLVDRGRLQEAETHARKLLARHADAGMLWKILSVTLVRQGKDAMAALERTAELLPHDHEAHRNLATARQERGQWAEALASLHRALEIEPHDADGFAEAADAMRALGRAREAVPLYERALLLDARLIEARNNLGNTYLELRRTVDAARCYRLAVEAQPDNPVILCNLGNAQRLLGLLDEAVISLQRAIALDATLAVAHSHLGHVLRDLGRRREALAAFERALALEPARAEAHWNLGTVLFDLRRVEAAVSCYRHALALQSDHAPSHLSLGLALRQQRRPADAEASCRAALAIDPAYVEALSFLGELHADRGEFAAAEALFRRAIELDPGFSAAYASIATHRKMTVADAAWLRGAESALAKPLPLAQEIGLHYAIGKYFDDVQRYDEAFEHYSRGNALARRHGAQYNRAKLERRIDALVHDFGAAGNATSVSRARSRQAGLERPILIVGMPRSGTSLAEQILASHPTVFGAGEVIFWNDAYDAYRAAAAAGQAGADFLERTARAYLDHLAYLSGGALRVVDKMPANFLYAGLIHAALPNARIIHMLRHPIDTCLSIYFQNFFNIGPYANDLGDLAHYYGEYRRITDHWRAVLPAGTLLEVPYEALIADQEAWTRRMLEFAELPWDPRCLDFHATNRVVITASKWQVRQKLHSGSAGRWRNYAKHVAPLLPLIELGAPEGTSGS